MYIIYVSLNYRKVPIEIRERFVISKEELSQSNQLLNNEKSIFENVILSTCNRTEVYAVVDQIHTGRYYIKRFLANWFHVTLDQLNKWITIGTKEEAVKHLMNVATGLDSLIVGEPQILGQVKNAYFNAYSSGTTGILLNHLFKETITFSKKMHTKYRVSELSQTSGQAGLHQIKLALNSVKGKRLVIVGAGEVGKHVLKNAAGMGFNAIWLFDRHDEKAKMIASKYSNQVKAGRWEERLVRVLRSDAVVLAVSAKQPVLLSQHFRERTFKTQVIIDLGVPRNLDNSGMPEQIAYYDIDHISEILTSNQEIKHQMIMEITKRVPLAVEDFYIWQKQLHVVPIIRELRESSLNIEKTVYDSLLRKLPELNAHERKVISKHMKSIVNQMVRQPIKEIKEFPIKKNDNPKADLTFFCQIFGLPIKKEIEEPYLNEVTSSKEDNKVNFSKQERVYEK